MPQATRSSRHIGRLLALAKPGIDILRFDLNGIIERSKASSMLYRIQWQSSSGLFYTSHLLYHLLHSRGRRDSIANMATTKSCFLLQTSIILRKSEESFLIPKLFCWKNAQPHLVFPQGMQYQVIRCGSSL
jgi:hypothetical protein